MNSTDSYPTFHKSTHSLTPVATIFVPPLWSVVGMSGCGKYV